MELIIAPVTSRTADAAGAVFSGRAIQVLRTNQFHKQGVGVITRLEKIFYI